MIDFTIYKTGAGFPLGENLDIILLESDSRGGSSVVKCSDGFWHLVNKLDDRIVSDEIVSNDLKYVKRHITKLYSD